MNESNIYSAFKKSVERHSERRAIVGQGGLGISYSYGELLEKVESLAAGIQRLGGDSVGTIGLLSENRPEWPIAYLSILAAGRTVVPIDANLSFGETVSLIRLSGIKHLLLSSRFSELRYEVGDIVELYCMDDCELDSWEKLFVGEAELRSEELNEIAALIYTSGTTGASKGVMLTHRNILSNIQGAKEALVFSHEDIFLSLLPLHHTFEATCGFLVPLLAGAQIVYGRSLKSRDIVEDIKRNEVTIMVSVPLLFEKMYDGINRSINAAGKVRNLLFRLLMSLSSLGWSIGRDWGRSFFKGLREQAGLSSIRMFVSGGAPLPRHIGRFFNLLGFPLIQGYGLTECSPIISANRPGDIRFDSTGPPLPTVEVRIDNPNSEGIGEIVVRGDNVTPGYKENPEATRSLVRNGWLYTGDLGKMHKGHLYITGRAKSLIVSAAGKNIYPEELEERLNRCQGVLESVVFGRAREGRQGEEVRAVIVPDKEFFGLTDGEETSELKESEIANTITKAVRDVNDAIASFKRISGFDIQNEELEKTSTRKVKRYLYR